MSVLIRNMEMPSCCELCPLAYRDALHEGRAKYGVCQAYPSVVGHDCGQYLFEHGKHERLQDCPLIPVPPHGDLIDRDELLKRAHTFEFTLKGGTHCFYKAVSEDHINCMPTIIKGDNNVDSD